MKQDDDHITIHDAEVAALEPTDWEQWVEQVEAILGYDTDGEFAEDGYSLGSFHRMWKQGWTVQQAAAADTEAHRRALLDGTPDEGT